MDREHGRGGARARSWSNARAHTVPNIILLAAVVHGYASGGPTSYRADYRHRAIRPMR